MLSPCSISYSGRRLALRPLASLISSSHGSIFGVAKVQGAASSSIAPPGKSMGCTRSISYGASNGNSSLNRQTPYNICFVRHGQSTWNRDNRFIGWTDTPLTEEGIVEARVAGQILSKSGMRFDEVHTSMLRRSIRTVNLILMELGQEYIPVHKHYRLNERSYGDLVGKNKKEVVKQHGKDQVKRWRRSYDEPPPPMTRDHPYWPGHDPRYQHVSALLSYKCYPAYAYYSHRFLLLKMLDDIPMSESLHCTVQRSSVYWDEVIVPAMRTGKSLMIVGHENNLRSLIMRLENIPKQDIIDLNLPRAVPLAYKLDLETMKPINMRPDGARDEATGLLTGEWLSGDDAVTNILDRDHKQVYDTSIDRNLEIGAQDSIFIADTSKRDLSWRAWMGESNPAAGRFIDMGFTSAAKPGLCDDYDVQEDRIIESNKQQQAA